MTAITTVLFLYLAGQAAQASPPEPGRAELLQTARNIMQSARFCALITLDGGGQPRARAMDAFPPEADMTVWLATNARSRKVGQIRRNPKATLYYFDPERTGYVSLMGTAELVTAAREKQRRWKEDWKDFYAGGSGDPNYVLIRFRTRRLEIISTNRNLPGDPRTWEPHYVDFP